MDNNNKCGTLRHQIIGYKGNISTMIKGEIDIFFPQRVAMPYYIIISCEYSTGKK